MRIRMVETAAGLDFLRVAGREYDVEDKEAKRMVAAGQATKVKGPGKAPKSPPADDSEGSPPPQKPAKAAAKKRAPRKKATPKKAAK